MRRIVFWSVVVFCGTLASHGTFASSGDGFHYQMIARSLAFDRDVDLANDYADPSNLSITSSDSPVRSS